MQKLFFYQKIGVFDYQVIKSNHKKMAESIYFTGKMGLEKRVRFPSSAFKKP